MRVDDLSKSGSPERDDVRHRFNRALTRRGLPQDDADFLGATALRGALIVDARTDIVNETSDAETIYMLLEGWACAYRVLKDGRRQIGAILLAGDVCNLDSLASGPLTFGVLALTPCRVVGVARDSIVAAIRERSPVRDMFMSMLVSENRALIDQVVNLGRRSARERTAFLLCDLLSRLQDNGEALDGRIRCPLTQADIADHLGLSTVHTNRAFKDLRATGLVAGRGNLYVVSDRPGLQAVAGF